MLQGNTAVRNEDLTGAVEEDLTGAVVEDPTGAVVKDPTGVAVEDPTGAAVVDTQIAVQEITRPETIEKGTGTMRILTLGTTMRGITIEDTNHAMDIIEVREMNTTMKNTTENQGTDTTRTDITGIWTGIMNEIHETGTMKEGPPTRPLRNHTDLAVLLQRVATDPLSLVTMHLAAAAGAGGKSLPLPSQGVLSRGRREPVVRAETGRGHQ